jgi:hypothetical protein
MCIKINYSGLRLYTGTRKPKLRPLVTFLYDWNSTVLSLTAKHREEKCVYAANKPRILGYYNALGRSNNGKDLACFENKVPYMPMFPF